MICECEVSEGSPISMRLSNEGIVYKFKCEWCGGLYTKLVNYEDSEEIAQLRERMK